MGPNERFGHQNILHVRRFLKQHEIDFVDEKFVCEACIIGKQKRNGFKSSEERATTCGEVVVADVCGPMQKQSFGGSRYFLLVKDDYSRFRFIFCIKQKSEVANRLNVFFKMVKTKTNNKVKVLRTDNGTEFVNADVKGLLERCGIRHQRTVPYTPEQNGSAERENRTVIEAARTMIHAKEMDLSFWAEAVNTAVFVLNRTGTSSVAGKTPFELWYGKKPKIDCLKPFGCSIYMCMYMCRKRREENLTQRP